MDAAEEETRGAEEEVMDVVCDTNIWYRIAFGELDPIPILSAGARLVATAITPFELVSSLNEENFEQKKKVAQAIVKHADCILRTPDEHLAELWGTESVDDSEQWWTRNRALADASSFDQLSDGVYDAKGEKKTIVNTLVASAKRAELYGQFVDGTNEAIDSVVDGYSEARRNKRAIHLPAVDAPQIRSVLRSPDMRYRYIEATYHRIRSRHSKLPKRVCSDLYEQTEPRLSFYVDAYLEFIVRSVCLDVPRPNDAGDLEFSLYVQDGRKLLTADTKWNEIARETGHTHCIFES